MNEFVKTDLKTAEVLNSFFPIQDRTFIKPLVSKTNDATLKVLFKYRNQPSIAAIQNKCKDKGNFNFIEVD